MIGHGCSVNTLFSILLVRHLAQSLEDSGDSTPDQAPRAILRMLADCGMVTAGGCKIVAQLRGD